MLFQPFFFYANSYPQKALIVSEKKMVEDQQVIVETLKAFLEAFNRHDLEAIVEYFADDCVMDLPRGPYPWGR